MSNQEAIALLRNFEDSLDSYCELNEGGKKAFRMAIESLELFGNSEQLPSAQPKQEYTNKELKVFMHGISMRLLSLRSAQHWTYDDETAEEIKFLERLYKKVESEVTQ